MYALCDRSGKTVSRERREKRREKGGGEKQEEEEEEEETEGNVAVRLIYWF